MEKRRAPKGSAAFRCLTRVSGLFADTELFLCDDSTVAVDVFLDQIIKETATLTYECFKCTSCCMIFVI